MGLPAPGTRIRLLWMPDDPDPIESGTTGTIRGYYNEFQMDVDWDNGRNLMLAVGIDLYEVIENEEPYRPE